jgi:hypothetical protein
MGNVNNNGLKQDWKRNSHSIKLWESFTSKIFKFLEKIIGN